MTKKTLNQNGKYVQKLIDIIEPDFSFNHKPINRVNSPNNDLNKKHVKTKQLSQLENEINSIENCNLKKNSKNLVLGDGNIDSSIMLIGEAPNEIEDKSGLPFKGEAGNLLDKMLSAINLSRDKIYLTYSINYRPPQDRKPTSNEIKRYSIFLKQHISIIDPKIIILMGATAMQAITNISGKISTERGKWREIIIKNKIFPLIITYSPSYLLRFKEYKKYSWEDLKKIKKKIKDFNISI